MNNNLLSTDELDVILAHVHDELEAGASADRIKTIANENPQARDEVFAFVAAWFTTDGSDLSDDTLEVTQTVANQKQLLDRFWELIDTNANEPFVNMSADQLQAIAEQCRINLTLLRQIVRRLIDETTIPGLLIGLLAQATSVQIQYVWAFLTAIPITTSADYFAPHGRKLRGKISFAEAVQVSDLQEADRQFWLRHLED